jgi:hypothetical protein
VGFGVGSKVPLGKCHNVKGSCVYTWNGFRFGGFGDAGWQKILHQGGRELLVSLFVDHGLVTQIAIADQNCHCPD